MTQRAGSGLSAEIEALLGGATSLGRYQLGPLLSQGGMASVYLAHLSSSEGFRKWFAIKIIHPHLLGDRTARQLFVHEARLAARLDHPNIGSVVDFGEAHGSHYLVMEFLRGETLGAVMGAAAAAARPIPLAIAARIVSDVARGLHEAHELSNPDGSHAAVVHRDVSPSNVFVLYNGIAKVMDFGIARSTDDRREQTVSGPLRGKLAYMSPEHVERRPLDRRADLFALGVVLWEATLGRRLFRRESEAATILALLQSEVPLPSSVTPGYPAALEAVVLRALRRDPDERYATAAAMADDLDGFLGGLGVPSGGAQVAAFMAGLFPERMAALEALLRKGETSEFIASIPSSDPSFDATETDESTETRVDRVDRVDRARTVAGAAHESGPARTGGDAGTGRRDAAPFSPGAVTRAHDGRGPDARRAGRKRALWSGGLVLLAFAFCAILFSTYRRQLDAPAPAAPHESSLATGTEAPTTPPAESARGTREPPAESVVSVAAAASSAAPRIPNNRPVAPRQAANVVPPAPRVGFLNLIATPAAEVTEANISYGTTPLVHKALSAGVHRLRLRPVDGQAAKNVTVAIQPDATTSSAISW